MNYKKIIFIKLKIFKNKDLKFNKNIKINKILMKIIHNKDIFYKFVV